MLRIISLCLGDVQMREWCRPPLRISFAGLVARLGGEGMKRLKGDFEKNCVCAAVSPTNPTSLCMGT